MNTNLQAEKLALLARDLTLFPESMDSVLAAYELTREHLEALENNPIFQSATTHALQQLQDDPLFPQRLRLAAKTSVLAEKLLGEAISGVMDHQNSIKILEFSAKVANMEPPKVTKATNTNQNATVPAALDPTAYRNATSALSDEELTIFETILTKMQQTAIQTEQESQ